MAKRDERAKLIDNIGRQIRRLNARERAGNLDDFQKRGLDRQRENLKAFRDQVKQIDKNDKVALEKAKHDYKNNTNFTTSQRKIDENTKKILASKPTADIPEPSNMMPPEESGGGGEGGFGNGDIIANDPNLGGLFGDLANLDGVYIGQYAKEDVKTQVSNALDKIKDIKDNTPDLNPETRERLEELYRNLESKSMDGKGNFNVYDDEGNKVGYSATWNHADNMRFMEEISEPVKFDVNRWIAENIELFHQPAPHRGSPSNYEKWIEDNVGTLWSDDYDY